jgi:hypothetical protein
MTDEHASLAKAYCAFKCRETIGYARDLLGGNGILLDNHVGGFVADVEAIYSYEGTRENEYVNRGQSDHLDCSLRTVMSLSRAKRTLTELMKCPFLTQTRHSSTRVLSSKCRFATARRESSWIG